MKAILHDPSTNLVLKAELLLDEKSLLQDSPNVLSKGSKPQPLVKLAKVPERFDLESACIPRLKPQFLEGIEA